MKKQAYVFFAAILIVAAASAITWMGGFFGGHEIIVVPEITRKAPPSKGISQQPRENELFSNASKKPVSAGKNSIKKKQQHSKKQALPSYPKSLMTLLGISPADIAANLVPYYTNAVHIEWMDHVDRVLPDLSEDKRLAIEKIHAAVLYVKDLLDDAYLDRKISHEQYVDALRKLMDWHQSSYSGIISRREYESLFGIKPEDAFALISEQTAGIPQYSFILNQEIPIDEVIKRIPKEKLEAVDEHFKEMIKRRNEIGRMIGAGTISLEDARKAFRESQLEFVAKCKEILTPDEINLIFGSETALESGVQTLNQAPIETINEEELGFPVENPDTTLEDIEKAIDPATREDLKFFHESRKKEMDQIGELLDSGAITLDEAKDKANAVEETYRENCKSLLTPQQYKLIFGETGTGQEDEGE